MKLGATTTVTINTKEVLKKIDQATRLGLRDTIVLIHNEAVKESPVLTGNNRRSLHSEVSGMGPAQNVGGRQAGDTWTSGARVVDDKKLEAAFYSTSGYGGDLEVGTSRMRAQPYIIPARDKHLPGLAKKIESHMK